jgi:CheY-like chemotaxis protein
MKILVVEDHPAVAELTCRLLRDVYQHEVALAATGEGAIEKYLELQPELVLVDIHLPDIDGYEVARRIRGLPGTKSKLLVALSGFECIESMAEAAGFDACFRKPMDYAELALMRRISPP